MLVPYPKKFSWKVTEGPLQRIVVLSVISLGVPLYSYDNVAI